MAKKQTKPEKKKKPPKKEETPKEETQSVEPHDEAKEPEGPPPGLDEESDSYED